MPRRNNIAKALIIAVAAPAFACTEFAAPPKPVYPSFTVRVLKFSQPVPGISVRLVHHYDDFPGPQTIPLQRFPVIGRAVTDASGIAHFTNAPIGEYDVVADIGPRDDPPRLFVKVSRKLAGASNEIKLASPALEFLPSQSMAGVLNLSLTDADLQLHLIRADSGRVIDTVRLNDGTFHFQDSLPPGPYYLRLEGKFLSREPEVLGDLGVWLDPSGQAPASINADVTISSCGVWYAAACSRPTVEVPRACGRLIDELGASFPAKDIKMLDEHSEVVAAMKTTGAGDFDFGIRPTGNYVIRTVIPGFPPTTQPVIISGQPGSTCLMPMTIVLGMPGRGCKTTVGVQH